MFGEELPNEAWTPREEASTSGGVQAGVIQEGVADDNFDVGAPSSILLMDDELAREARIESSKGTGTSEPSPAWGEAQTPRDENTDWERKQRKVQSQRDGQRPSKRLSLAVWRAKPSDSHGGSPRRSKSGDPPIMSRRSSLAFSNRDSSGGRRRTTIGKFLASVRRHSGNGSILSADTSDIDDDYGLWFTSEDDFNPPTFVLSRSETMTSYFVKASVCKKNFVMNVYHKDKMSPQELARVRNAVTFLLSLRHPYMIHCVGTWETEEKICIVEEYCFKGDLLYQMVVNKRKLTETYIANKIVRPLLDVLSYLHGMDITHRAIWPESVTFGRDGEVRLSCFQYAINMCNERPTTRVGYLDYMAPEVIRTATGKSDGLESEQGCVLESDDGNDGEEGDTLESKEAEAYDEKVDIWQLGVLLYELLTGKCPFEVEDPTLTAALILWATVQKYPPNLSPGAISFIEDALTKDPSRRPSADELLNHPWLEAQEELAAKSSGGEEVDPNSQSWGRFTAIFVRIWESMKASLPRLRAPTLGWSKWFKLREGSNDAPVALRQSTDQDHGAADAEIQRIMTVNPPTDPTLMETPITLWSGENAALESEEDGRSLHSRVAWSTPSPEHRRKSDDGPSGTDPSCNV